MNSIGNIGDVRLKGRVGAMLDKMISNHVAGTDVDYITAPFLEKTERNWWWQTEFWGKYMHSAVPYSFYAKSEKLEESIDRGFERILSSQELNGYIGNYPDENRCAGGWDVWGIKYSMMGLLHYSDRAKAKGDTANRTRALDACLRLCRYVNGELGPNGKRGREIWQTGWWSGFASCSILEPVVWLYKRTGEKDILDFADFIVSCMRDRPDGPRLIDLALKGVSVADRNGYGSTDENGNVHLGDRKKAYEMISCYQGLLEYWEVKTNGGKETTSELDDILKAAVMTADDIVKEELNLAGGCASEELWYHGASRQFLTYEHLQETCVTITWMRFCEKLFDITGDIKWADQIEKTFYNAYLGALKTDGSEFAGYTPLSGNRWHGQNHCFMHTDCCTANGPRGFLCFLHKLFETKEGAAYFNFYTSALVKGEVNGKRVAFDMYSLYPRDNMVRIVSHTEGVGEFPLKLRIPGWCETAAIYFNGQALDGVKSGSYFEINREWQLGDVIEIRFEMPIVAHVIDWNVAFTRGPVLLARDTRLDDGDMMEPYRHCSVTDGMKIEYSSIRSPSDAIWMEFAATLPIGIHHRNPEGLNPSMVLFCDYASAGNAWERSNYYRTWFPMERSPR